MQGGLLLDLSYCSFGLHQGASCYCCSLTYSIFGLHQGAVATLSGKSSLLDPTKLDQVEGRLQGLQGKLNAIAEKKATLDEEKLSKVG